MDDHFSLNELEKRSPMAVIEATGRLTSQAAQELHLRCEKLFENGFSQVIVKMSDLTFIASSGVGTLVKLTYDFLERGGFFQLTAISEPVMSVIDLLNSRQFLNTTAGIDDAKQKLELLRTSV